jgi:hypothetical protein
MSAQSQDADGTSDAPLPGSYTLSYDATPRAQMNANFLANGAVTGTDTNGVSYSGAWTQTNLQTMQGVQCYVSFSLTAQGQSTTTIYLGEGDGRGMGGRLADSAGNSGLWTTAEL